MSDEGNVDIESSPPATTQEPGTKEGSAQVKDMSETPSANNSNERPAEETKTNVEPAKRLVVDTTVPSAGHQRTPSGNVIDTAAPIESVREAVSKFGGITDWKAVKAASELKRKIVENKLEKVETELTKFKKQAEEAKEEKENVLHELDSTKRLIEELKMNLERVETEEKQAKQDSELAKLRVEEVQQGIAEEASVATNTEFEVAQARHAAAVTELKSVKDELEKVRGEYASLIVEKDLAVKRAEEAVSASVEVENTVEALTFQLIEVKGSLESAHSAHLEAQEERVGAAENSSDLEKELNQAEEELEKLNQNHLSEKEIKLKLDHATALLINLKTDLEAHKKGISTESEDHEQLTSLKSELDDVRVKIESTTAAIDHLKVASASLESELKREKSEVSNLKSREGMLSVTVTSLEDDLSKTLSELDLIHKEKAGKENVEKQATADTAESKFSALLAHTGMSKAKEEGEVLQAGALTIERRLQAVQKEIEASRASERLALAAIKALEETEFLGQNSDKGVTLSAEEYQALSKRAEDVEEQVKLKVAAALSQIEEAKQSEMRRLEKLEEVNKEKTAKAEELKIAVENAAKAEEGKLATEQELRKWRNESEQRRRASDCSTKGSSDDRKLLERSASVPVEALLTNVGEVLKKKKKRRSLFPRIVMFLARRKFHTPKPMVTH